MIGLSTNNSTYQIEVLVGPTFAPPSTPNVTNANSPKTWHSAQVNLTSWQGQQIKLRITAMNQAVGVDNVGVQWGGILGWEPTEPATVGTETNNNHYIATANTLLTSAPFTLSPYIQQITLRHRSGSSGTGHFMIRLHRLALNQVVGLTTQLVSQPGNWQTLTLGIHIHAGENVKLEIEAIGAMHFDDIGIGERLLPRWKILPPSEDVYKGIAIGEDERGSYVTSADGTSFKIQSELISTGIIDNVNHGDIRYYAIGYAIGQSNPSSLDVSWVNSQGQVFSGLEPKMASSPTGYQEAYFRLADSFGPEGYFVISVTGGGKVYSIADNIARQHLAEPFSYKVGITVDTSTGAFGYEARDLEVDGLMPLVFTRYYNGHSDRLGPLGHGWSHSYETRLAFANSGDVGVIFGSGKEVFFSWNGYFVAADIRVRDQLLKNADGSYTYISQGASPEPYSTGDQCSLIGVRRLKLRPQRQTYHFNSAGQLTSVVDHNFLNTALLYNPAGQLTFIASPGGATLSLFYKPTGQLEYVQSSLGATAIYDYPWENRLGSVTRSDQGVESYEYSSGHTLYRITDANGQDLITNTFDDSQRVYTQTDAQGKRWILTNGTGPTISPTPP